METNVKTTVGLPQPAGTAVPRKKLPPFTAIAVATVLLFAISASVAPRTMSSISLLAMLPFAAVLAVAAVGQTFVVQQRGIDLSVGGTISLAAITVSVVPARTGIPTVAAVVLALVLCALVGALNSILVSKLAITPLVSTLAMNALLTGAVVLYTKGSPATAPQDLSDVVSANFLGLPALVWFAVIFVAIIALFASRTVTGRQFVLSGANPSSATISAIRVDRNILLAYIGGALCYGTAGVLLAGFLRNTAVGVGNSYLMSVIAVVIVGGTPLTGGKGTIIGTAISALFLSQLIQLVLTLGAPTASQLLIQAVAIAVAAILGGVSSQKIRSSLGKLVSRKQQPEHA
ncbi:ABC transporter permease [Arthrobacter sp. MMS24-T111]